jgi:hypothetical protein
MEMGQLYMILAVRSYSSKLYRFSRSPNFFIKIICTGFTIVISVRLHQLGGKEKSRRLAVNQPSARDQSLHMHITITGCATFFPSLIYDATLLCMTVVLRQIAFKRKDTLAGERAKARD